MKTKKTKSIPPRKNRKKNNGFLFSLLFTISLFSSFQLLAFDEFLLPKIESVNLFIEPLLNNAKQQKFTLSGVVKDGVTGETLLGANIIVKDSSIGSISNEYGFYSITLPEGNYTFQVSYLGYASKEIVINLDGNKKFNFELEPESNELNEVVILSENATKSQVRTIISGVSNLKTADIKKLPAFFGEPDITRAVLTQPGVSTVGEGTTGFNIRGGNIDQNLVLLDEAPLYNTSHLWGFFSVFNTDAVKDLKLYKGGIPARTIKNSHTSYGHRGCRKSGKSYL